MNNLIPITRFGYEALISEMKNIKDVEAPKVTKAIAAARLLGDLSENAEYHGAKEKQGQLLSRYKYLENIYNKASVIDVEDDLKSVVFGCYVRVFNFDADCEVEYQIVGDYENDPKKNMISNKTPIARALLGKKVGDVALVELVNRELEMKVLSIRNNK